jgi:transmembrane sensor
MEESLHTLFTRYLVDLCSEQEIQLLFEHFKIEADEVILNELILEELKKEELLVAPVSDIEQRLDAIYQKVKVHIGEPAKMKTTRLWPRIAVAVSIAVVITVGGYLFFEVQKKGSNYGGEALPGKNIATLTLASGKKITLSDAVNGELAEESGIHISKTGAGQIVYEGNVEPARFNVMNILSTAKSQTYSVRLPDGTNVSLNAASSLRYPTSFTGLKTRTVELTGEAYFEVSKDKTHPFLVKTYDQEVEVLGTHFNINAYRDESGTRTTLLEGAVKVSDGTDSKMLSPGQQSLRNGKQFVVIKADTEEVTAWKNGYFNFNGEDIKSIMRKLDRWYNIEVDYQGKITEERYYAKISRTKNISAVLKLLEQAEGVHFKIEGRRIIVMQ